MGVVPRWQAFCTTKCGASTASAPCHGDVLLGVRGSDNGTGAISRGRHNVDVGLDLLEVSKTAGAAQAAQTPLRVAPSSNANAARGHAGSASAC